jgi:thiol:disulfide interchange protein DsbD
MTRLLLFLSLFFFAISPAKATPVYTDITTAQLLSSVSQIKAGEPFWLALHLDMKEGWHSYWRNPGDSGLPTEISINAPEGFEIGPPHWPTPERIPVGPITNYGYDHQASLLIPVIPSENLTPGTYSFNARADWLVCEEICIPESGNFSVGLSAVSGAPTPSEIAFFIEEQLTNVPSIHSENAQAVLVDGQLRLTIPLQTATHDIQSAYFFPYEAGIISHSAEQSLSFEGNNLLLNISQQNTVPEQFEGVLRLETSHGVQGLSVTFSAPFSKANDLPSTPPQESLGLLHALLFAFLGGLILNIMPCVLPILSLKALGIAQKADSDAAKVKLQGLAYTLGVVSSFLLIAGVLIILQQGGEAVGWGYQMQSPVFVTLMAYLLFVVGLNLSGYFDIPNLFGNVGNHLAGKDNVSGSFFIGVLYALVATPCTAPFMATAVGVALIQTPAFSLSVFFMLGLGLATPYLLVSWFPSARKWLPKPGAWMDNFKQFLAFPMYASVIWLLWVLVLQSGSEGLVSALVGLLLLVFFIWLWRFVGKLHLVLRSIIASLMLITLLAPLQTIETVKYTSMAVIEPTNIKTEAFSLPALETYIENGQPVFVNATASWCITCKINERVTLKRNAAAEIFNAHNVIMMEADWTNEDEAISAYLASFGRQGVPLYVYYPPNGEPRVLPQILSVNILREAIAPLGK